HVLLEARELCESKSESAVVAEVAQVTKMIGDALALEKQPAQPRRACRDAQRRDAFDGLGVGPGVRDGAIARDASGEAMGFRQRKRLEALFDTFVHKGETLFEAQDLLADDLEAEMAGFDDARMHRSDSYFVHTVAVDPDKRVILLSRLPFWRRLEIASQRKAIDRPRRLPSPRALVIGVGLNADQIERGALHPVGGRKHPGQIRVVRALLGQRVLQQSEAFAVSKQYAHTKAAMAIALVACPQRDELSSAFPCQPACGQQLAGVHRATLGRNQARQWRGGNAQRRNVHGAVTKPG